METDKGFRVVGGGNATKECKNEASFVYINFAIGKALRDGQDINNLKRELKRHKAWSLRVEKIPKEPGLFLSYQKFPRDPCRIFHYFLEERDSYSGKVIALRQDSGKYIYVELIEKTTYRNIKDRPGILFSPEGGCEEEIIRLIDGAEKTFDAAVYSFTNPRICDALKRARSRGVVIRLILNGKREANKLGKELESCGMRVKYYSKKGSLMHNKFAIIDEDKIFSGSYNWTPLAEKENRENLIILSYIAGFRHEFDYLWENRTRPPPKAHSPPSSTARALFSPKGGCEEEIIRCIRKVKDEKKSRPETPQSIKIALYYFTNKNIAKELFDAKEAGVDVEIVLDKTQKSPGYAIEKYFRSLQKKFHKDSPSGGGKLVIRYYRIPKGMMHNKFAIIGDVTITGSYNWTKSAESKNRENIIILPIAVKDYNEEFIKKLWAEAGEEVVIDQGKLGANLSRAPPHEVEVSRDEPLARPADIAGMIDGAKKILSGHLDSYKSSGLDPPILDARTGEALSLDELNRRIVPGEDRSCFWSGRTGDDSTGFVSAGGVVEEISSARGRITLGSLLNRENIQWPGDDDDKGWRLLSGIYAKNSAGIVYAVLGRSLRPGNVWDTIEERTLRANKKVIRIVAIDPKTRAEKIIWQR